MAITKIHAIKSTLGKALAYIENPDKTDGQMLVSGYNCEPQTASIDFEMTAVLAHKARNLKRKRSTNLAYHLIQSFSPEDAVTPEQAHELGKKLAFEYTGGKYEYVVATHIDKGHIHNHIMLNAVSFYDYKTLRTVPYRTARQIRDISDRLCMEAHLSVIDDPQKIGQLYPENAGKKKSASNRTEIRKRLDFCLERATDYSQFLSMAEGLEITPTIRGKHMSYLLEGAGRAVRDNSLSDTDTFTYAGICARLSDNAQEQKYLRKTITGILRSATGMADFADKLKTAGIETKVKKSTGQVLYRAAVLDGAWVPEDALGSEFTSEGIEYALKNGEVQIAEDAEITLIDRYQELTIQYPEVCTAAVKLSSRQILSAGKNGLVLQVHDDNGNPAKLMVNKSEVTTSPDGEIIFNVGNDFSYDLVYEDGTHGTIRGAKLIQQIDEENNVLPLAVVLTEGQIKTMSLRGVTIALPSKGIERLFIPEKYVVCNAANGQCAVSLYPNHQYSYIPTSGENKRNSIQGDQLAAILGVAINPSTENTTLSRRIAAVERRMGIENAKNLGKVLLGMTSENMYTAADYDKAILSLGKKQIDLTNKISAIWTMDGDGEVRLTIMASIAQDESRKTSERVKAGQKMSREKGVLYGSGNIIGYDRVDGTYVINEEQAATVRRIFNLYAEGHGETTVAKMLIEENRKDGGGGLSWTASKVSRVLRKPTYKGYMTYNKSHIDDFLSHNRINHSEEDFVLVKGNFEPIVSEELWETCNQIRSKRAAFVKGKDGRAHKFGVSFPQNKWTKILFCDCGMRFQIEGYDKTANGGKNMRLICARSKMFKKKDAARALNGIPCPAPYASEWKLELMAREVFRTVWKENAEDILGLLRMLDANLNTTGTPNDGNQLENKLSALNKELDDLVSQRASRSITMDDFLSKSTEINNEIINVEGLLQSSIQEQRPKARLDMHSIEAALSDDASFPDGKIEPGFLDRYANRIVKSNNRYIWMLQLMNVQQIMPIQSERQPIAMVTYKSGVPYDIEQEQIGKQDKESAGLDCATICRPQDFFLNMGRTTRKRKLVEWLESCQENQVSVLDEKIPLLSFAVDFVTAYEYQKARGIKIHPGLWKDMRVDIFLVKKEN